MNEKLRTILALIAIGIGILVILSLLVMYFSLETPVSSTKDMVRDNSFLYEAQIEESGTHSTPELTFSINDGSLSYLRIRKTQKKTPEPTQIVLSLPEPAEEPIKEQIEVPQIIDIEPIAMPEPITEIIIEKEPEPFVEVIEEPIIEIIPEPIIESIPEPTPTEEAIDEEDFWADFFVQGEDLLLESGYYLMSLYINDEYVGETEVLIEDGISYLSMPYLEEYTSSLLSDEAYDRLFGSGIEYIAEDEFQYLGLDLEIREAEWSVYVYFGTEDMPWKLISIAGLDKKPIARPIAGAETLKKSDFSLLSKISQTVNLSLVDFTNLKWNYNANIYNNFSIFEYTVSHSFSISSNKDNLFAINLGNLVIYREFQEKMIRAEAGNVQTSLLSPNGSPFGVAFKKDFAFAELGTKRMSVHNDELVLETQSKITVTNAGKTIYEKVLEAGNYIFEDFVLHTGLNSINILVEPTNGAPSYEVYHEFSYANSLYAPSESFYGASMTFGIEQISSERFKRDGALTLNLGKSIYQYDIRNFALSGYYNVGITKSLSINTAVAVSNTPKYNDPFNPNGKIALEINAANPKGVLKTNINLSFADSFIPSLYFRIGQQIPFESSLMRSLNLGLTYNSSAILNAHTITLSASTSGKILKDIGWNANGSVSINTTEIATSPFNFSIGLNFAPANNASVSASANLSGTYSTKPTFTGRIFGSISLGKGGSATTSFDENATRASYRVSAGTWSYDADISAPSLAKIGEFTNPSNTNASMRASASFDKVSIGASISSSINLSRINASLTASTNILYADGAFAITSSAPSKYLLVKQEDDIKTNIVSISSPGQSNTEQMKKSFSSYLYGQVSTAGTSLELYSSNEHNSLLSVLNRSITIPAGKTGAFVYTIQADELYQISGLLEFNGNRYPNYSSPVYDVVEDENENITLVENSQYFLFTDAAGRFCLNDVAPGKYAFDLLDEYGAWHLCMIEITGDECNKSMMNLFEADENYLDGSQLDYNKIITFKFFEALGESEYWNLVDSEWEDAV